MNDNERTRLQSAILKRLRPKFYKSGFLEPDNSAVRLFAYSDPVPIDGYVIDQVLAVTEEGVVTDAYGGGMVITPWNAIPVEDLQLLEALLAKKDAKDEHLLR